MHITKKLRSRCGSGPAGSVRRHLSNGLNATIQDFGDGRVELIATVTNNSGATKTLSDIDIDNELHKKLNLQPLAKIDGDYIPIDNTVYYTINQELIPSEAFTFRLRGRKSEQFTQATWILLSITTCLAIAHSP